MKYLSILFVLTALSVPAAFAEHGNDGPGGGGELAILRLQSATQQLKRQVRYAPLSYRVKQTVFQFTRSVQRLVACSGVRPIFNEHGEPGGGGPIGGGCSSAERIAKINFRPVARYLYDTDWDMPMVHNAYLRVSRILSRI
jgi:hypothetical protein